MGIVGLGSFSFELVKGLSGCVFDVLIRIVEGWLSDVHRQMLSALINGFCGSDLHSGGVSLIISDRHWKYSLVPSDGGVRGRW